MRAWAATSAVSTRTLGMRYGMLIADIADSNSCWPLAPSANSEAMVGAALRCNQDCTCALLSITASSRSTETVCR
ncbi:hypothetical protein D3C86_2040570 [compost metagenome]